MGGMVEGGGGGGWDHMIVLMTSVKGEGKEERKGRGRRRERGGEGEGMVTWYREKDVKLLFTSDEKDAGSTDVVGSFYTGFLCPWLGNGSSDWAVQPFNTLPSCAERCHSGWCHIAGGFLVFGHCSVLCGGVQGPADECGLL